LLPKADVIVHLASKSFIPDSFKYPDIYYNNNFLSTLYLLEKARQENSRFVFASTYVYGSPQYLPIDESHPRQPLNPYTQSKVLCEDLCIAYNRDFKVPVTIFRPFNVYGPGQSDSFFIPTILRQLKEVTIQLQDPRPKRDFIFVDDVIDAFEKAINNENNSGVVYNLGSGISYSVSETVHLLKELSDSFAEINFSGIQRQGEVLETIAGIDRARKELGWSPQTLFIDGLRKTVVAYKEKK
jgi:UDP-glucose 4-epimerase